MKKLTKDNEVKYFDSIRPYRKRKNPQIIKRILDNLLKLRRKKPEITYLEPIPDEPVIFISNHAIRYGPFVMTAYLNRPRRIWALSTMFYVRSYSRHAMVYWYPNARGIKRLILRAWTSFLALIFPFVYRSYEAIPVYKMSLRLKETYEKTIETLQEGLDVVIFPESRDTSDKYKYTNQLQNGFARFIPQYYAKSQHKIKIYPVYCCKPLDKIIIGKPYEYNPDINIKQQSLIINDYIQDSIEELCNSLPEHKIEPYSIEVKDMEYVNKMYKGIY